MALQELSIGSFWTTFGRQIAWGTLAICDASRLDGSEAMGRTERIASGGQPGDDRAEVAGRRRLSMPLVEQVATGFIAGAREPGHFPAAASFTR